MSEDVGEPHGRVSNSDDEWVIVVVDCCVVVETGCVPQEYKGGLGK